MQENQAEQQAQQEAQQAEQQHQMQQLQQQQQFEAEQNELDRQSREYIADQMSAARAVNSTSAQAGEDAFQDATKTEQAQRQHTDKVQLEKEKLASKNSLEQQKLTLGKEKVQEESKRTSAELQVARINNKVKERNQKTKK